MFKYRLLAALHAPAGDGDGGGGSGDDPKPLTEEDVARIANSAFTAQMKRLDVEGKIQKALSGLDIDAKLEQLAEKLKPAEPQDPKPGDKDKDQVSPEIAKQLKALSDQVETEKAARLAAEKAREDAEKQRSFDAGRQELASALKEHAEERLHDVWIEHLVHNNRLKVEDGTALLEVEHAPIAGMAKQKEFLPLTDAVQHLLKEDGAKRFMAPPEPAGGRGSPGPKPRGSGRAFDPKNPADVARAKAAELGFSLDDALS